MEIRVLRYFLTVAREGSITRAANFLHLTQPTLSRQLQDLEKELGQKLFIRGSHNISLTPEGMILRKRAEEIVDMVDKTESVFRSISDTVSGDIYIGGGETESMKYIAEVIKDMREEYPAIKYHLYSGNAEDVTERLDKGLLDFGILIQPTDLSKYEYITLPSKDVWGVLMKKDSALALKKEIKLDDLYDLPLICSRQVVRRTSVKNDFLEWFGGNFEKMNVAATYNLVYNARIMVEEGIGYALTLDKLVNTMHTSNIAFRPLSPKLESGLDIVWKKYQIFSPAANLFLSKLRERFL
ncbi:MAG TPA: LysR family transcriptional regulator [Candidatus Adamsella sp.]|nr:LysR family transcriptional regulator [Candidatus Adamsella sp.]